MLAEYFEQLRILERESLAMRARSLKWTRQDWHPTVLMAGGLKALGESFPGFERDLASAGAVFVTLGPEFRYARADFGLFLMRDLGLSSLCGVRPLIECVLRRRDHNKEHQFRATLRGHEDVIIDSSQPRSRC